MILTLRLETQRGRATKLIGLFSQIYEVLSAAANTNTVVTLATHITRSGSVGYLPPSLPP